MYCRIEKFYSIIQILSFIFLGVHGLALLEEVGSVRGKSMFVDVFRCLCGPCGVPL